MMAQTNMRACHIPTLETTERGRSVNKHPTRFCNFCGFSEQERFLLVAGPAAVFICDECIPLAQEVVAEERIKRAAQSPNPNTAGPVPASS